jgi:hypothetical protein
MGEYVDYRLESGKTGSIKPERGRVTTVGPDADGSQSFGNGPTVTADRILQTEYGPKVGIDSPYEAKDAIKALDFDETHRSWDSQKEIWTVDLDAIDQVREKLTDEGFKIEISNDVLEAAD